MTENNTFAHCATKDEALALRKELNVEPRRIISDNAKAYKVRCAEIRKVELAPYHDKAKRWKHGQKVYLGIGDNLSYMSFETMRITKSYLIKTSEWCYVWQYQSRKKILWLCQPGKKCEYKNLIDRPFTLDSIERHKTSRTEPSIRA